MNDMTNTETERNEMGAETVMSRRHRFAMAVGVTGLIAALATALLTAAAVPRLPLDLCAPAAPASAEVGR